MATFQNTSDNEVAVADTEALWLLRIMAHMLSQVNSEMLVECSIKSRFECMKASIVQVRTGVSYLVRPRG